MRPVTPDDAIKSIRIKTGSLRRLFKERAMYAEEIVAGERKVAEMRARGAEPSDIKQQVRGRFSPRRARARSGM